MNELADHGADLSQPREVTFYCYAASEDVARAMVSEASHEGFDTEVWEGVGESEGQWAAVCKKEAVVDALFVRGTVEFFESLAARHGAEYDGWEAIV